MDRSLAFFDPLDTGSNYLASGELTRRDSLRNLMCVEHTSARRAF
jgi:hypothetical protein